MCKQETYPFRRDNGQVVRVSFEQMMQASGPYLTLDGESLIRAYDLEPPQKTKIEKRVERASRLSDALGFTKKVLKDRVEHLKRTGIRGIEFKEDPQVPGFYQVECDTERSRNAYASSMGLHDRNSMNGSKALLNEGMIDHARELVLRNR